MAAAAQAEATYEHDNTERSLRSFLNYLLGYKTTSQRTNRNPIHGTDITRYILQLFTTTRGFPNIEEIASTLFSENSTDELILYITTHGKINFNTTEYERGVLTRGNVKDLQSKIEIDLTFFSEKNITIEYSSLATPGYKSWFREGNAYSSCGALCQGNSCENQRNKQLHNYDELKVSPPVRKNVENSKTAALSSIAAGKQKLYDKQLEWFSDVDYNVDIINTKFLDEIFIINHRESKYCRLIDILERFYNDILEEIYDSNTMNDRKIHYSLKLSKLLEFVLYITNQKEMKYKIYDTSCGVGVNPIVMDNLISRTGGSRTIKKKIRRAKCKKRQKDKKTRKNLKKK